MSPRAFVSTLPSLPSLPMTALLAAMLAGACAKVEGPGAGADGTGGSVGLPPRGGNTGGPGPATGSGGDARGTMGAGGAGGEASCGVEQFDLVRKPGDVVVVLDRSASMQKNSLDETPTGPNDPTKWSQLIPALTSAVSMAGVSDISWGLKTFPEDGAECAANTVTPRIDLGITSMNAAQLNTAIMATLPNGNGTPTGAAVTVAANYLRGLNDGNKQFLVLATDGQPSCGGGPGALVKSTPQAQTDAVAAVAAAAAAGIHTFVVGVATKPTDGATLNLLAMAGLEPRADPNPLATRYYLGSTNAELVAALRAITGVINKDCIFPFSKPPPVPDNIAVKVSGVKAPPSTTDGWSYTDDTHLAVQVFGSWCEMIKTAAANRVQIVFGCPDVPIP